MKINLWASVSFVLALLLALSLFGVISLTGMFLIGTQLSAQEAGNKAINFINENLLQGQTATLVDIKEVTNNVYTIVMDISGQVYESYITKDGSLLFPTGIDIKEKESLDIKEKESLDIKEKESLITGDTTSEPTEEIPKSDKPKVELFVMSFCPYGNRAEDTMLPVYNLLKDKVDWQINYIVSVSGDTINSLHGQPETDQDIREVCVKKEYGLDKFWEFTTYVNENCGRDGSCWKDAAKEAKISTTKIQGCFDKEGLELMKKEAQKSNEAGASGSPTLIINGVETRAVYQYENPEAYKQAICSAFNNPPEECNEVLEGSSSSSAGGSC